MTPREYAHSLGLAKMGRGKLSSLAHAAIDKARAEGMTFTESSTGAVAVVEGKTEDVKAKPGDSLYLSPSDFRFPEAEYVAYFVADGKKVTVSLRECCNTCRVSLTNHACASPTIHDSLAVTIERG